MTTSLPLKNKGPIINPALCRCCRSIKKCRLLTTEYDWLGKKEIYSDMFMDCFGLLLSHLDGDAKDTCICATCVTRLREAHSFRLQVLDCEQAFLSALHHNNTVLCGEGDRLLEVEVKAEPLCSASDDHDGDVAEPLHDVTHDSDSDEKPLCDISPILADVEMKERNVKKAIGKRATKTKKQDLLHKVRKLGAKLDKMLDKPAPTSKLKTNSTIKPIKKPSLHLDRMIYENTVTIAHNSYICPFLNRISIYYCYYCKDQFTNPNELREHTMTHNPKEHFENMMECKKIPKMDVTRIDCRLCTEKIDDVESFKHHIANVHGKLIHSVSNEFLKFKLTMDDLTCTECNSSFPYFDVLKKHMIEHFGKFTCDICGACFLEDASLRTHIKSHSKVEKHFPCEVCGKNLKSKYSRYLHVATVHEKKPTVNCYKCEESFLSYALRNKHLIEVHGDKRTFPCKLCDKVYNRRKTLMEHNRRNHLKNYKHQCDLCDQKFYLPSRLKEHMATHTGERNFRCEFCDKSYPRLQSLQEHIRSHSNDRRFKCDLCHLSFTQNGSLKSHMKSHHQGFDLDASFQ